MNSTCRSIDLATNIIAPIAVGQVMYFLSHIIAAIAIASWNIVSFFIEFFLLWNIYQEFPKLAAEKTAKIASSTEEDVDNEAAVNEETCWARFSKRFALLFNSWSVYFGHEVRNAGIGLACLYLTVLGFDAITTGYAYSQGVPESILGILLAVGACMGLLGSIAFPALVRCIGVERTGIYGFALEIACLTLCVGSVWAPGSPFDLSSANATAPINNPFLNSNLTMGNLTSTHHSVEPPESYTSIILLMSGIIAARFGMIIEFHVQIANCFLLNDCAVQVYGWRI